MKFMCQQSLRYRYLHTESTEFLEGTPLKLRNMFEDMSEESKNKQTKNFAPIQFGPVMKNMKKISNFSKYLFLSKY